MGKPGRVLYRQGNGEVFMRAVRACEGGVMSRTNIIASGKPTKTKEVQTCLHKKFSVHLPCGLFAQ